MAQCEAEGRKHPTMDLYVGIFNSKFYTSSRGNARANSAEKWPRNAPSSAHGESFREYTPPADRNPFQSRSFRDKPAPVLSDLDNLSRKPNIDFNEGSTRSDMEKSVVEMGYGSMEGKCSSGDKMNSSLGADCGHVGDGKKDEVLHVNSVGDEKYNVHTTVSRKMAPQAEVGHPVSGKLSPQAEMIHPVSGKMSPQAAEMGHPTDLGFGTRSKSTRQANPSYGSNEMGHVNSNVRCLYKGLAVGSEKEGSRSERGRGINHTNSPSATAVDSRLSPHSRTGYGSIQRHMTDINVTCESVKAGDRNNRLQITSNNRQINAGDGINDDVYSDSDFPHSEDKKNVCRDTSFGSSEDDNDAELRLTQSSSRKSPQSVQEGVLRRNDVGHSAAAMVKTGDVPGKHADRNAITKSHDFHTANDTLTSVRSGSSRVNNTGDMASATRSFSSSSESARLERKLDSMDVMNGAVSVSGVATREASGQSIHISEPDLCITPRHQRSAELNAGARFDTLPVNGRRSSSNEIQQDRADVGGMSSGMSGEVTAANCYFKSTELDHSSTQGNANGLVFRNSPNRGHNFAANLRVVSTDSSSSHGGSSHSGSPTAVESVRESRASTFGNILISKGSPHSVSSRSMGSVSVSGYAASKSSFNDIPAPQFRYSTSSGRKSAEIVPNRRSSEMVPNRKSSEMISNGHSRGAATHGSVGDGVFNSGSVYRGNGNCSNGNVSLSNGSLLVGSANGSVLSVGGGIKSSNKHGEVANLPQTVDSTLLKKAQASSDPEEMKNAGNEYYRRGHFTEALALYSRAVSLCPRNAAYRSNRAAALSGLSRLGEAVQECEEAIGLDANYARAHQRIAALYLRLGLTERAKKHFNSAGQETDLMEAQRLRNVDGHISRCMEARRRGEWQNVIRESDAAIVAGADSAPQIFGYKSEALLGLHKPDEADDVCTAAQRIERSLVKAGVLPADPYLLVVRVQIDMALGRFEGAVEAAKSAAKIDPHAYNVAALLRKAQTVCHTRATGNDLFKAGRFFEALALYAEGLESDPSNAVLLCNRAACRSKLGQWEKAVEDCSAALRVQPNYTKALMRRANCWTKLERWEDALQDYEFLRRKLPDDLEVARGLFDVHVAIKKSRGEDTHKMKFGGDVQDVSTDEEFQEAISSPGLSVVQFVTRWSERCRQLSPFVGDLCKRNPCINFMKVDVEELPYLAKIESVSFIPTFKIYKNGQKVKEILGPTEQSLEYALKHYAS